MRRVSHETICMKCWKEIRKESMYLDIRWMHKQMMLNGEIYCMKGLVRIDFDHGDVVGNWCPYVAEHSVV